MKAKKSHGAVFGFGGEIWREVRFTTDYKKLTDVMIAPSQYDPRWVPLFTSEHLINSFLQHLKGYCFERSPFKISFTI